MLSILSGSIGAIATVIVVKTMFSSANLTSQVKKIMNEMLNNAESQKQLYALGVLVGSGIRSGVGLNPKAGKFKFEDLIQQGIGMFLQNFMKGKSETEETTEVYNPFAKTP